MGKQKKTLKYPEGVVTIPEGLSPKSRKCYRQHNYEAKKKEERAAAALLTKMLRDLTTPE